MRYSAAIVFFFRHLLPFPFPYLLVLPSPVFFSSVWWIGFQPPSINAISHRSCLILPQRHMCGDTDQRRNPHFRAMGLGCMQHKTCNGGLASDSYWCTVGLCVTKQADQHKHAHQCSVVLICKNDGTENQILGKFTHNVTNYIFIFIFTFNLRYN